MKRIILLCSCVVLAISNVGAQSAESDVNIGVVCPEQMEDLSSVGLTRLQHKIEQIATANGVATYSDGTFVMYPVLDVFEVRTVENGLKNITVTKAEMVLSVIQISSGMKINSVSTTLSGSGFNRSEALTNAISGIDIQSSVYKNFLSESKERIYSYYETNCTKLLQNAEALAAQQQYEAALAQLACFPASLPSYAKVVAVMTDIYKRYQNVRCEQLIQQAKGCIALKDYTGAVEYLVEIDPESQCKSECAQLLRTIKQQVDKAEADQIDRQFRVFDSLVGLEKQRIATIRDIAKTYYENQPTIHYHKVIAL